MLRHWLQRYRRTLIGSTIGAGLVVVMLRLADLTARQTGATDRRLDGAFYLATILSIAAMLALRDWARRRGE